VFLGVISSDTSDPTTNACIAHCQCGNESVKPNRYPQNVTVLSDVPPGLARRVLGSYACPMGQDLSGIDGTSSEQKSAHFQEYSVAANPIGLMEALL